MVIVTISMIIGIKEVITIIEEYEHISISIQLFINISHLMQKHGSYIDNFVRLSIHAGSPLSS